MQKTSIQWCDYSANLLKYRDQSGKVVWHCEKCSTGCANCYAEAIAQRFGKGGPFAKSVTPTVTPFFDEEEARKLLRSKKLTGQKVFVNDMTDTFGEWVPDEIIDRHFAVFALRPDVTFQVLTKRAGRMAEYMGNRQTSYRVACCAKELDDRSIIDNSEWWPLKNVWLGVSVEDQQRADERIPHLLRTPAAVRFLSCEPLLGEINLGRIRHDGLVTNSLYGSWMAEKGARMGCHGGSVSWVIVGGESGPGARPCQIDWIRSIVRQCAAAQVPCFVKQLGKNPLEPPAFPGHVEGPLMLISDPKGGDPSEWPEDLRVREFPEYLSEKP